MYGIFHLSTIWLKINCVVTLWSKTQHICFYYHTYLRDLKFEKRLLLFCALRSSLNHLLPKSSRIVKYFKLVFEVELWKFNKFQVTEFSEATVSFVTLLTGYLMWPTLCSWSTVLEASWTREQLVAMRHWWETTYHISSPSASRNFKNNLVNEWSFSPWSGEPISDWTKV